MRPPPNVGMRKSERSNIGCSTRRSTTTNPTRNAAAEDQTDGDPAIPPAEFSGPDQTVHKADQSRCENSETEPVRTGGMGRP